MNKAAYTLQQLVEHDNYYNLYILVQDTFVQKLQIGIATQVSTLLKDRL